MATDASGYVGFAAGMLSGATKLVVGHPFDTIKVRMQTNTSFKGPLDCLWTTVKNEGVRGLYKGATPPLVGWTIMDSVMLGSLHNYRMCLKSTFWPDSPELPFRGKVIAGVMSGWTVSFVAAPIEHVKALLQIQYNSGTKKYKGPIDCVVKLVQQKGVFGGLYHGLFATMLFRTNFCFWWGSYDLITKWFERNTSMSAASINFWAGGLSGTVFWATAYPSDIVKQQIMCDDVANPKYKTWMQACKAVYARGGARAYFRGFLPSILRSFPVNASALAVFEATLRVLKPSEPAKVPLQAAEAIADPMD